MKRPWNRENVRVLPAKINLSQQPWCRDALLLHVRGTGALRWESWALLTAAGGSSGMCWTAWSQTPPPAWSISTMMITTTTTNVCLRCSSTPPSGGPGWIWSGWKSATLQTRSWKPGWRTPASIGPSSGGALVVLRSRGDAPLKNTALRCAAIGDAHCSLKVEAFQVLAELKGDLDV